MAGPDSRFDDGKDAGALRTIGEVSSALGIRQHVLRYWEQQFPMLRPLKRSGGRRLYRADDVALVAAIDRMVNTEGYTIKGARLALEKERSSKPVAAPPPVLIPASSAGPLFEAAASPMPADAVARLKAMRARLASALDD